MKNILKLIVILSIVLISSSCNVDPITSDEVSINESSLIIGETMLPVGKTATYMVNHQGAKNFQWSFPASAPVTAQSAYNASAFEIKGEKKGKFVLNVFYEADGYTEYQEKYIKVTVY